MAKREFDEMSFVSVSLKSESDFEVLPALPKASKPKITKEKKVKEKKTPEKKVREKKVREKSDKKVKANSKNVTLTINTDFMSHNLIKHSLVSSKSSDSSITDLVVQNRFPANPSENNESEQNQSEENQAALLSEQNPTEQNLTEQNLTEQNLTAPLSEQNLTEQNLTEQNLTEQNQPEQNQPSTTSNDQELIDDDVVYIGTNQTESSSSSDGYEDNTVFQNINSTMLAITENNKMLNSDYVSALRKLKKHPKINNLLISSNGEIYDSNKKEKCRKTVINGKQYLKIGEKYVRVEILVFETYVSTISDSQKLYSINNNGEINIKNLFLSHRFLYNTAPVIQYDENFVFVREYGSMHEVKKYYTSFIEILYSCSQNEICPIKAYGFYWSYKSYKNFTFKNVDKVSGVILFPRKYAVNEYGMIFDVTNNLLITPYDANLLMPSYAVTLLNKSEKLVVLNIEHIVWETFKYPISPEQYIVHINGNKKDNRLSNIMVLNRNDCVLSNM